MVAVAVDINSSRFDVVTFLERLEDLRKQRGWTWSEWERQAKLNPRHISAILNRARARDDFRPDWQTLRALAKAAGIEPFLKRGGEVSPFEDPATDTRGAVILYPAEPEYIRR